MDEPGGSVLGVGCGDGTFVHLLRERGMQAYGVDGSANLIDAGKKRCVQCEMLKGIPLSRRIVCSPR